MLYHPWRLEDRQWVLRDGIFLVERKQLRHFCILRLCHFNASIRNHNAMAGATGKERGTWTVLLLMIIIMMRIGSSGFTDEVFLAITRNAGEQNNIQ